jgi:hypothetical protein
MLEWTPAPGSEGTYELELTVTGAKGSSKAYMRLRVKPKGSPEEDADENERRRGNRWSGGLYPGANLSTLTTFDAPQFKTMLGAGIDFNLYGTRKPDKSSAPGQARVYLTLSFLRGTATEKAVAVRFGMGFELSFEANATRTYLIPNYGIQFGAFAHKSLDPQGLFYVQPQLGIYWYSRGGLSLGTNLGLFTPVSGKYVDSLTGLSTMTTVNVAVW